jgi:hypothetical protein
MPASKKYLKARRCKISRLMLSNIKRDVRQHQVRCSAISSVIFGNGKRDNFKSLIKTNIYSQNCVPDAQISPKGMGNLK